MAQPKERDSLTNNRKSIIPLKRFRGKRSGNKRKNMYDVYTSEKIPGSKYGAASKNPPNKGSGQNSGPGNSPPSHVVIDDFIEELSFEYECPSCGKPISEEMVKCPNCGTEFSFEEEKTEDSGETYYHSDTSVQEKDLPKYECPVCGATVTPNMTNCPICEVFLRTFIQFD